MGGGGGSPRTICLSLFQGRVSTFNPKPRIFFQASESRSARPPNLSSWPGQLIRRHRFPSAQGGYLKAEDTTSDMSHGSKPFQPYGIPTSLSLVVLFACLFACLLACLFVWFVCLFACLFVCLFVCWLVCLFVFSVWFACFVSCVRISMFVDFLVPKQSLPPLSPGFSPR